MRPARVPRVEQVEQNRGRVLEAARRVFLTRGYAGASLDAIAEEAGFSKGVVYSQFDSKADLFFALLERRIADRAEDNERIAAELSGPAGVTALLRFHERSAQDEPEWALLLIEFRVHAARMPELQKRYAALHAQTADRLTRVLAKLLPGASALRPRELAEVLLTIGTGIVLERMADADALSNSTLDRLLAPAIGGLTGRASTLRPTKTKGNKR